MKQTLRTLCKPILDRFETGTVPYAYKSLNRKILIIMGLLFAVIAGVVISYVISNAAYGYALPAIIFSGVAITCIIVGGLGTERAVAKIWGNK